MHISDEEILKRTIDYCVGLGMEELSVGCIGRIPPQPETSAEMDRKDRLPRIITYDVIRAYSMNACHDNILEPINYFRHFGIYRHLEDLGKIGYPEYSLEWLVSGVHYMEQRKDDICIVFQEEMLRDSLDALENKYGKRKVASLKRRLGIGPIMHDAIEDHHRRFGKQG
ncbi:hypothetical protein JW898_00290 [Candidatus Woesearchaeota archaeon]|nr:hypothetical protein [Candidatus Woesearchaeota archaeon]